MKILMILNPAGYSVKSVWKFPRAGIEFSFNFGKPKFAGESVFVCQL